MASLTGPNPLSVGEYSALQNSTGAGAAAGGASGLAQTILGQPQAQAQAGYLGAQTALAQTQAAGQQQTQSALSSAAQLLQPDPANPTTTGFNNPNNVAAATSAAMKDPTGQAAVTLGRLLAIGHATVSRLSGSPTPGAPATPGGASGVTPAQADAELPALTGQSYAATATGDAADNANRLRTTQVSAGATLGAAQLSNEASHYGADQATARTLGEYYDPTDPTHTRIIVMPTAEAGQQHLLYASPTQSDEQHKATPTLPPGGNGAVRLVPQLQAIQQGLTVAPNGSDQAEGALLTSATSTPPPPPTLSGTISGAPNGAPNGTPLPSSAAPNGVPANGTPLPSSAAPNGVPAAPQGAQGAGTGAGTNTQDPNIPLPGSSLTRQQVTDAIIRSKSGLPQQPPVSPVVADQEGQTITAAFQRMKPLVFGTNTVSPALKNAVLQEKQRLLNSGRIGTDVALSQAIQNVAGPNGENLVSPGVWDRLTTTGDAMMTLKPGAPGTLANTVSGGVPPTGAPAPPAPAPGAPVPPGSPPLGQTLPIPQGSSPEIMVQQAQQELAKSANSPQRQQAILQLLASYGLKLPAAPGAPGQQ
jgi:hypothetical protein